MAGPWIWDGPAAWPRSPPAWDGSDFPSGISQRAADQDLVLNERLLMPGGTLAPLICLPARHRPEDFSPCYKHFTSYYISEVLPGLTANLSTPVFHSSFFSLNPVPPPAAGRAPLLPLSHHSKMRLQGCKVATGWILRWWGCLGAWDEPAGVHHRARCSEPRP